MGVFVRDVIKVGVATVAVRYGVSSTLILVTWHSVSSPRLGGAKREL